VSSLFPDRKRRISAHELPKEMNLNELI